MPFEKFYTPAEAAPIIRRSLSSTMSAIRSGKIVARMQCARGNGKRPHYLIAESELHRYLDSMPMTGGESNRPLGSRYKKGSRAITSGVIQFV